MAGNAIAPLPNVATATWESMAKLATLTGGILYIIGLIVTNVSLSRYASTDFALVRPQCILTGAWATILIFAAFLPTIGIVTAIKSRSTITILNKVFSVFVGGLFLIPSVMLGYLFTVVFCSPLMRPHPDYPSLDIGLGGWRELLLIMNVLPAISLLSMPGAFLISMRRWIILSSVGILPALVSLSVIGYDSFEQVNSQVGGGRPTLGFVYFSSDGQPLLSELKRRTGSFHDSDPTGSIEAGVLHFGAELYILQVGSCASEGKDRYRPINAAVSKKLVQAVVFPNQPKYVDESKLCP